MPTKSSLKLAVRDGEARRSRKQSRLNNIIKLIVVNINIVLFLWGIIVLGMALYLLTADWGGLDQGFFVGVGCITGLLGLIVSMTSCLGCIGIDRQTEKLGGITGRKVLLVYQFLCFSFLLLCGVLIGFILSNGESIVESIAVLDSGIFEEQSSASGPIEGVSPYILSDVSFGRVEQEVSEKFNAFFFGVASVCCKCVECSCVECCCDKCCCVKC